MKVLFIISLLFRATVADDTAVQKFKAGNLLFTSDLYNKVSQDNTQSNLMISPFSLETALAFAQSGCKGATAEEIRTVVHLPNNEKQIEEAMTSIFDFLTNDKDYTFNIANKMYVQEDVKIKPEFADVAKTVFHAEVQNVDFGNSKAAAAEINSWVEAQTNNKIHNIVSPDFLSSDTRLVLLNALYLQPNWSSAFDSTKKADFYKSADDVIKVDMMYQTYEFFHTTQMDAQFLQLPFVGEDAFMMVVLPNKRDGPAALETQKSLFEPPPDMMSVTVDVELPKFLVESSFDLSEGLREMGIRKAFDQDSADLSGISGEPGNLTFSGVVQKMYIKVNEVGVEAASATATIVGGHLPAAPPPENIKFTADHPFLFYIKINGIIIFAGRVLVPEYTEGA